MSNGMYGTVADGSLILVLSPGICPPHGPITHTCDQAASIGFSLTQWWPSEHLLDADGNCRFCGERV